MTQPNFFERANNWIRSSVTIRLITIGILILLMLIPIFMIQDLIRERERNQESATYEVSRMWGESQTLHGLVLTVPYLTTEKVYDNTERSTFHYEKRTEYAHFLPDEPGEGEGPPIIDKIYGNTTYHYREHLEWMQVQLGA